MDLDEAVNFMKILEKINTPKNPPKEQDCECHEIKIAILQRGWVMVGRFGKKGTQCFLEDASIVRNWGSTKGLGEIASNGPTDKTILDPCGKVEFHELTAVALVECSQDKWKKALK